MALQLTVIVQDVPATNIAAEAKRPSSPLRKVHKLFDISATGVVTLNTTVFNQVFPADNVIKAFNYGSGTLQTKIV